MTNFSYHILRIYFYERKKLILLLFFLNCFNDSVAYECNVFSYLKTIGGRPAVTFLANNISKQQRLLYISMTKNVETIHENYCL